jgi:hypothetical protein
MDLESGDRSLMEIFDFSDCLFQHLVSRAIKSLKVFRLGLQKFVNLTPRWDSALTAGLSCFQRRCCRSETNAFAERRALS